MTKHQRCDLEFLPAVLELQETPPSPIGASLIGVIIAFFCVALFWASFSKVDIVAVASGRTVPSGRVKTVQSLESGQVRSIHVENGQHVHRGQVLIELDSILVKADLTRLQERLRALRHELILIDSILSLTSSEQAFDVANMKVPVSQEVNAIEADLLTSRLRQHWLEYSSANARLMAEERQLQSELAAANHRVNQITATLPLLVEHVEGVKQLVASSWAARSEWLMLERERLAQEAEREIQIDHAHSVHEQIARVRQGRQVYAAQFHNRLLSDRAKFQLEAVDLREQRVKAERRLALMRLTAPVAGVVQELAVHTVGGVVTSAQPLMIIVPDTQDLFVEAWLQNKDIGFVHIGQAAEVKVEAFPFTQYGLVAGEVVDLSRDSVEDEERGSGYIAQVALQATELTGLGRSVALSPGMAVSAEIKTGERRVIEFLLSPLLKALRESARER